MRAVEGTPATARPPYAGPFSAGTIGVAGRACAGCGKAVGLDDMVGYILVGPGDDSAARAAAAAGKCYPAIAVVAHWACITGVDPCGD